MFKPDILTVLAFGSVMSLFLAVTVLSLYRNHMIAIRGLGSWAAAVLCYAGAGLLLSSRLVPPALFPLLLANTLLMFGHACQYQGLRAYFGQPTRWRPHFVGLAAWLAVYAWYLFARDDRLAAVVMISAGLALYSATSLYCVMRQRRRSLATRSVVVALLMLLAATGGRLLAALLENDASDRFNATLVQTFYVTGVAMGGLLLIVGNILLINECVQHELDQLASHDALTGALTRRALLRECELELERCRRHGRGMALLVMDLDHFKSINDQHGHHVGDQVLQGFAQAVKAMLRDIDRLGRLGGEEFVVMLPETDLTQAMSVAERIRVETPRLKIGAAVCSVSIGVTAFRATPDDDLPAMLLRADQAMYQAKKAGRDRALAQA